MGDETLDLLGESAVGLKDQTVGAGIPDGAPGAAGASGGWVGAVVGAGPQPAADEPVALAGQPLGLVDAAGGPDEQVLHDQVEAARRVAQVGQCVPGHHLDPERVEVEVPAGSAQHATVALDADDLGPGVEGAEGACHAAGGQADLVSFGAPFLANPDLPLRFARMAPLNAADTATYYAGEEKGYTDYPALEP